MIKSISFVRLKLLTLMLFLLFVFLFTALIVYEEYQEFSKEIKTFKQHYIQNQKKLIKQETLRALRYISYKHQKEPHKPLEALKKEIVDAIEYMRNERDGTGYIFIYTFDGVCVADPILRQNKGKNLLHFKDPTGKEVIKELIDVAKKPGGGYVRYYWNKPIANTISPKLSYATAYEPFGWMIGSGVYLDEIEKILQQKEATYQDKMIKYIINIVTLSFILFALIVASMRYVTRLIEASLLKIQNRFYEAANHNRYIYTDDLIFEEFKQIARYANKMIKIIKERTKKLQELNKTLELKVLQKTRKLHEQNDELKASKALTEKLLKDRDRFIKTAVHEINTPLGIILANIDLLKMDGIKNRELTNIESGIKIIHNIYNDLAYLIKKDRVDYPKEWIDMSDFLKKRVEFFEEIAKANHLRFQTSIEPDIWILANAIELQRLIDNNLSNAIKYAFLKSTVYIHLFRDGAVPVFEIATNSPKIEDKEAIFGEFTRQNEVKGGFGLGLALVKEICNKYGCTITLRYEKGLNIFTYRFENEDLFTRR